MVSGRAANSLGDPSNSPVVHTFDAIDSGDRSYQFVPGGAVADFTVQNDPAFGYVQSEVSAPRRSGRTQDLLNCGGDCPVRRRPTCYWAEHRMPIPKTPPGASSSMNRIGVSSRVSTMPIGTHSSLRRVFGSCRHTASPVWHLGPANIARRRLPQVAAGTSGVSGVLEKIWRRRRSFTELHGSYTRAATSCLEAGRLKRITVVRIKARDEGPAMSVDVRPEAAVEAPAGVQVAPMARQVTSPPPPTPAADPRPRAVSCWFLAALGLVLVVASAWWGSQRWSAEQGLTALVASGTVEADEILIGSEVAGRLVELPVVEGQAVRATDVLARLDSSLVEPQITQSDPALRRQLELQADKYGYGHPCPG